VTTTIDEATIISADTIAAGATVIAEAFGLGDSTLPSTDWPVDDGDSVIAIELEGALTGQLLLAVNDEVAGRLNSDPSRLREGFTKALAAMLEAAGVDPDTEVSLGEIGSVEDRPIHSVELYDGKQMCALFGAVLASGSDSDHDSSSPDDGSDPADPTAADAAPQGGPAVFEPAALAANGAVVTTPSAGPLSLLQEVEMNVSVELGRTSMPIRELLALQPGMVVEIDRQAGAPIDVLVNGRLIACGEVVVIDEEFGIRITEIVEDRARL
jgi:flagellar motor switch protein FliN/FliY